MRIVEIFYISLNNNNIDDLSDNLLELIPHGVCNGYLVKVAGMDYGSGQAA
jgi:hypothetical protein